MIPIGAPVTAMIYEVPYLTKTYERISGTLHDIFKLGLNNHCEIKQDKTDYGILCITDSLRVRYDAPAPFTLWQLNVLSILPTSHGWQPLPASPDYPKLGNEDIKAYWEWFQLYNEHPSVN